MGAARDCSLGGGVDLPAVDRAWATGMTVDRVDAPAHAAQHD
jgi:hypothetical protein